MNYTTIIILELFIDAGVSVLPPEYISEHGGDNIQEVFMYFETNVLNLPNNRDNIDDSYVSDVPEKQN